MSNQWKGQESNKTNKQKKNTLSSGKYCHGKQKLKIKKMDFGPEKGCGYGFRGQRQMVSLKSTSGAVIVLFCFQIKIGTRKEIYTEQKFTFGTKEVTKESFQITYFTFNLSNCDKTELPDPSTASVNASGYICGWICFVWREFATTVESQGFILKTKHTLCSTQPFSTLKIFLGFKRDNNKKNKQHKCHI